jgi:hypothetical protein
MRIDISICPTSLEDIDGHQMDEQALIARIRQVVSQKWPNATLAVQVGHRQGDEWYKLNGRPSQEVQLCVVEDIDWTDEDLWNV